MIVNVHAHIRPGDDIHQRVDYFRAPGMERVCLSGDNNLALKAAEIHRDFVIPVAAGDLDRATPGDIQAFARDGFRAVRFEYPSVPYDDDKYFPLYEKMQELGLPVFLNTGHARATAKVRTEHMHPICLDTIARFFPDLYIVGSQLGHPWFFEALTAMMYNRRVFFDLSGGVLRALPLSWFKTIFSFKDVYLVPGGIRHRLHDESLNTDLFRKLVFGSGGPQPEIVIAFYRDLFQGLRIDFSIQGMVLSGNAAEMLGITDDGGE